MLDYFDIPSMGYRTQWAWLIVLSALLAAILKAIDLPASLLMGPMIAGVIFGVNGASLRIPQQGFIFAQGIIGTLVATSFSPSLVSSFLHAWPLYLSVVAAIIFASSVLGYLISRWRIMPGTTSVWGSWPGGASAMVVMAEAFGADARLVAFMQYLRVACVVAAASLVAHFWVRATGSALSPVTLLHPFDARSFLESLAVALGGATLGHRLRLPAGSMIVPMILGGVLQSAGAIEIELPQWLLAVTYAFLGWRIGLGFTREIVLHAVRAFPAIFGSILTLLAFCGGLAFLLNKAAGVDALTAYLATSPGGLDSVAIIASTSRVDLQFVMALQTLRFAVIVIAGPPLARMVARRLG